MCVQLTKTTILSSKIDARKETLTKNKKYKNWSNEPIFRFYKKQVLWPV